MVHLKIIIVPNLYNYGSLAAWNCNYEFGNGLFPCRLNVIDVMLGRTQYVPMLK